MINTQYINLNMTPSGVMPVLYVSQYDVGRPLGMVVYNGGEAVDLSTYTVTIEGTRTDGTPITAAVTTDGNIGGFATTATMTNKADCYQAKMVIADSSGNRVASLAFVLMVTPKTMDENAESIEEDKSLYQQYTGTVQTLIADIRSQLTDLKKELNDEVTRAESAESSLQSALSAETAARQAEDQTLQSSINAETSARQSADNTLQSDINAEASARQTADASLQSQINQLVAPSGEAPSAAEVQNARIGADNVTYPTLGEAIRTQNANLKSALTNPDYSWAYGRYISSSGVVGNDAHYAISTLISCKPGDVLQNLSPTRDGNNHAFTYWINLYSNGVWQSRQNFYSAGITIPSGIDGFRFSVGLADVTMTEDIIGTYFRPSFFLQGIAYDSLKKAVDDLYNQNSVNLLGKVAVRVLNSSGIVFDNRGNSTCAIKGTATADSFINLVDLGSGLALPFEAGATYVLEGHAVNAKVQMAVMKNGAITQLVTATDGRKAVTIPADADGLTIRVFVSSGKTVNEVVRYACYNSYSNKELTSMVVPITEKTLFDVKKDPLGSCDLNEILEDGSYLMIDSNTYENAPVEVSSVGMLNVYHPNTVYMQVFVHFTPKNVFIRRLLAGGTWTEWYKISGGGGTNNFIKYSNTYDISVSPSISSDATYYLPPTNDTTDRTAEIVALLQTQGICRLGAGRYYVKNLAMPNRSMIIGSGPATRIVLADGDGFAISLGTACAVKDAWIMGASEITPSETLGERNGIVWAGTYTDDQTAPSRSTIENLHITSFTGSGIACYDTGYATKSCIEVSNVYCYNCGAGVNISYWSEFNKFTNVHCTNNWYGCINNGGNNIFVNCDFSTNHIGFLMDNEHDQSPNNSHGSAVGCVFNHSDNNTGIGIKILNCDNGFIFDGCQVFFSQIFVANSDGVAFTNCNMGASNCDITIGGGGVILFANNLHQAVPTINISGNNKVHFTNCYVRSTGEAVAA